MPYHEPHSADGQTFIRKVVDRRWEVWFNGVKRATCALRREARKTIRALKRGGGQYLSRYDRLMEDP